MSETLVTPLATLEADREAMPAQRIGELFDRHHQRLFRLARRLSSDAEEARDLVQETFLRVAKRPGSIPVGESRQQAWLVRVLVNLCRDRFRRLAVRRRPESRLSPPRPPATDPESQAVARATVQAALERLAPRRRAVVVLRELEGRSVHEIASLLGLRPGTVRWHLSVGRKELAELLCPRSPSDAETR